MHVTGKTMTAFETKFLIKILIVVQVLINLPANNYLFKVTIETLEKGVKYVQT